MINIKKYFSEIKKRLNLYTKKDLNELHLNYENELQGIETTYTNKLMKAQAEHQNKLIENDKSHQNKLEKTESEYANSIDEIKSTYKKQLNKLETAYKHKLHQALEHYQGKLVEMEKEHEKSLEKFTLNSPRLKFVEASPKIEKKTHNISFSVEDEKIKRFVKLKDLGNPTDEQWEVILCKNNTQLVAAAAGSGKSTTMLIRIVVLIKFANVNPTELVVFSFTKKSCEELRDKLEEHFEKAELVIQKPIIEKMIRTFHSKVYEVAKESGLLGSYRLFEFIKDTECEDDEVAIEVDNTFNNSRLTSAQTSILKEVYTIAYTKNKDFKEFIHQIYLKSNLNKLLLSENNKKNGNQRKYALSFSKELARIFKDTFETTLDTSVKEGTFSQVLKLKFYYHLYLEHLKVYLIFSPNKDIIEQSEFNDIEVEDSYGKQLKLLRASYTHKKVYSYCDSKVIFVENQQHLNDLVLINSLSDNLEKSDTPIVFDIKISTLSRQSLVYEFFYTLINFIESTGLSFEQLQPLTDNILKDSTFEEEYQDIYSAMIIYWQFLNEYLKKHKIYQFSNLLKCFSENNINFFNYTTTSTKSMKHILIDEFQDISPEIVSFIKGAQKYLLNEDNRTTLMCIGDDWQSIYGWRGSTPSYLIDFKKYFNCHHDALIMSKNFRSSQKILSKAEKILDKTEIKLEKKVIAVNKYTDSEFEKVYIEKKFNQINIQKIIEDINKRIIEIKNEWPKASIYVLCRQNSKDFKAVKGADKVMTFHSSKGLEADVCFLIGDCFYKEKDIIRNLIYRLAKYNQTYDESQYDEQLRLAYVAATRAKKYAYWYGLEESGFGDIFD